MSMGAGPEGGQARLRQPTWADIKNGPVPRWWSWVAVTLVAVYVHILVLVTGWKGLDLGVYRAGGLAILNGIPLYSDWFDTTSPENLRWTYSPFGALAMTVWAVPPFNVAYLLWTVMSTWCLWGLVHIAGEGIWSRAATSRGQLLIKLGLLALGLMFASVVDGRHLGQIGVLLVFAVVFDWAGPKVSWLPRGVLTGVAAAVKLTPGLFIVWLVATRRWRDAAVAAVAFGAATIIGAVVRWGDSWQYFFGGVLSNPERVGDVRDVMNQSLWGLFHHQNTHLDARASEGLWLVSAVLVGILSLLTAAELERAGRTLDAVLAIGLATVLMSPVSWLHHGVWAFPAAMVLAASDRTWVRGTAFGVAAIQVVPLVWTVGYPIRALNTNSTSDWLIWYGWTHIHTWTYLLLMGLLWWDGRAAVVDAERLGPALVRARLTV